MQAAAAARQAKNKPAVAGGGVGGVSGAAPRSGAAPVGTGGMATGAATGETAMATTTTTSSYQQAATERPVLAGQGQGLGAASGTAYPLAKEPYYSAPGTSVPAGSGGGTF